MESERNVLVYHLGEIPYADAWALQESLFNHKVAQKLYNRDHPSEAKNPSHHLLFVEHPHVYTLGKSGIPEHLIISEERLREIGATFFKINRGGDITYHGPGQMVFYPILDLDQFFTDIHLYLRLLEEAVMDMLSDYGIKSGLYPGYTGVWLDPDDPVKARKICAMGIRTSRWVTMHGIALNVNTDLNYFNYIVPCGITDKAVTSMDRELGQSVDMREVQDRFLFHFNRKFKIEKYTIAQGTPDII